MGKYVMVVQSQAKPGRDDEYNQWYDDVHFAHVCAIPGVKSGRRFEAVPSTPSIGKPGLRYLAIFEIEAEDPNSVVSELRTRAADGTMDISEALDSESVVSWLYKVRA